MRSGNRRRFCRRKGNRTVFPLFFRNGISYFRGGICNMLYGRYRPLQTDRRIHDDRHFKCRHSVIYKMAFRGVLPRFPHYDACRGKRLFRNVYGCSRPARRGGGNLLCMRGDNALRRKRHTEIQQPCRSVHCGILACRCYGFTPSDRQSYRDKTGQTACLRSVQLCNVSCGAGKLHTQHKGLHGRYCGDFSRNTAYSLYFLATVRTVTHSTFAVAVDDKRQRSAFDIGNSLVISCDYNFRTCQFIPSLSGVDRTNARRQLFNNGNTLRCGNSVCRRLRRNSKILLPVYSTARTVCAYMLRNKTDGKKNSPQ